MLTFKVTLEVMLDIGDALGSQARNGELPCTDLSIHYRKFSVILDIFN